MPVDKIGVDRWTFNFSLKVLNWTEPILDFYLEIEHKLSNFTYFCVANDRCIRLDFSTIFVKIAI